MYNAGKISGFEMSYCPSGRASRLKRVIFDFLREIGFPYRRFVYEGRFLVSDVVCCGVFIYKKKRSSRADLPPSSAMILQLFCSHFKRELVEASYLL